MGALIDAEQADRLRREGWNGPKGPKRLSEELHNLLTSDAPYKGDTINLIQNGGPVINIVTDGSGPPITQGPPVRPGDPPNTDTTEIGGGGGLPGTPEDTTIVPPSPTLPTGFPIIGWGIITAKVSDNVYAVNVYLGNPSTAPLIGSLNVVQRQIDIADEIPAGTEAILMLTTSTVSGQIVITAGTMQVPVFLEP